MKIILNLLIALAFIGIGSLASASDNYCWLDPETGFVCCTTPSGMDICQRSAGFGS